MPIRALVNKKWMLCASKDKDLLYSSCLGLGFEL